MKIFISYANVDGLGYAKKAREIFEKSRHETWLYENHKTPGAPTWREISTKIINESDAVFYICTPSSSSSYGQGLEAEYALNNRVRIIPVRIDTSEVPPELTAYNNVNWEGNKFSENCTIFAHDLPNTINRIPKLQGDIETKPIEPKMNRQEYIKRLNSLVNQLDLKRVQESKQQIMDSYLKASIPRQIALIEQTTPSNDSGFVTIQHYELLSLDDFNSPQWWWGPYFSDLGRALARGERSYLQKTIKQKINADERDISRSVPDFQVLEAQIAALSLRGIEPDTILAPVNAEIYLPFTEKYYAPQVSPGGPRQAKIGETQLNLFWSNKYSPLDCFIIFSHRAGTWNVVPDEDTGAAITIALGQSKLYTDKVEVGVETTVKYEITQPEAFCVIPLVD
ncbi:MAG: toll/interleukin-1 receptor domain-containing protein [Candidatus Tectomicrobia bacterium]|uniref:Toll/interleukin-1 receptor domain-containing protein n=1 Tax=Tectimicrobiota bacterium TaxID=2528274 RepID=A0A933GLD6_UNCTE|nr:toll/interleukin-1 receptor domain-containing protein [Candidatus Tectomicrobia bacterium]